MAGVSDLMQIMALFAVLAGITWVARFKEGFSFRGEVSPMSDKHEEFVKIKCQTGATMQSITSNEKWDYLGKYKEEDVKRACHVGTMSASLLMSPVFSDNMQNRPCKNGRCPLESLRAVRPCLNKKKTKCCNADPYGSSKLTRCVKIDGADTTGLDNLLATEQERRTEAESREKRKSVGERERERIREGPAAHAAPAPGAPVPSGAQPAAASETVKYKGYCIGTGGQKVSDVSITWGSGDGKADMAWACNAWYKDCGGQCRVAKVYCSDGSRLGSDLNTCYRFINDVGNRGGRRPCSTCERGRMSGNTS